MKTSRDDTVAGHEPAVHEPSVRVDEAGVTEHEAAHARSLSGTCLRSGRIDGT